LKRLKRSVRNTFCPYTGASNRRTTDIAAQYPNQPVCKEPIFLGIRKDLQRTSPTRISPLNPSSGSWLGKSPIPSGGSSGVWPRVYGEDQPIAIKVIQFYESGDTREVGFFDLFSSRQNLTACRIFGQEVITWERLPHPSVLEFIGVMMVIKNPLKLARSVFRFVRLLTEFGCS